ncbi:PAS domain S-box protein [Patescibacteria group bacterium]|nr:PAS domain S-box protein [Patescibacteria group bacterium]
MLPKKFPLFSPQDSMLFEGSPEVVLFLDLQGKILNVNQRVYEWIKVRPNELIGKSIFELAIMTPESREMVKKKFQLRLNQKTIEPYEIQVFDRNGKMVVGRVSGQLIKQKGQVAGVLVMVANVTQLEQEMQSRLFRALESEARYISLFENMSSSVAICEFDEKTGDYFIKSLNRAFLKSEKVTKKAVIGESLRKVLKQKPGENLCILVKKAWQTEIPQDFTLEVKSNDNLRFIKGTVYRLRTGELTVMFDDVTQGVLDQQTVKRNEVKFRTTFNNANDAMFIMQAKRFIDCNKKTLAMYGLTDKKEIVGHTPVEYSPIKQPDGMSSGRKALQYLHRAEAGRPQRFYWQHKKKNGELFDVEVSLNRFYLNDEQYLLASVRDVTDELRVKKLLAASEQRFRSVVENAQAIIFALSPDGKFILSEGKKLSLLGLKSSQIVGASIFDVYKDYPTVIKGFRTALTGKVYREILPIENIFFDVFYSPIKEEETGKVIGVIGMAIDVTESEKFKARLLELDKSKSEFIATASHQLRSPLANIRWGLELLLADPLVLTNTELQKQVESVHESNLKVINLVNNLLDTSRIYSNKLSNHPRKIEIIKELKDLFKNFEREKMRLDLEVFWNIPDELELKVDQNLFKVVLTNLAANAFKYNKKNGVVVVFIKEKKNFIEISIANTGKSIVKEEQVHIFEKFYRGSNVTMEFEGTGLGLYIASNYTKFLGGKLSFESGIRFGSRNIEGDKYLGTIFHVSFPKL